MTRDAADAALRCLQISSHRTTSEMSPRLIFLRFRVLLDILNISRRCDCYWSTASFLSCGSPIRLNSLDGPVDDSSVPFFRSKFTTQLRPSPSFLSETRFDKNKVFLAELGHRADADSKIIKASTTVSDVNNNANET